MKAQLNNMIFPRLPNNLIIAKGECEGIECNFECEAGKHLAIIENERIISVEAWSGWVDPSWHEPNYSLQIKLSHYTNTQLLAKYPGMAQFSKVLPVHTDLNYLYMYCNRIEDSDRAKLQEFDIEINSKPC